MSARASLFSFLRHYEIAFALRIIVACFFVLWAVARFA